MQENLHVGFARDLQGRDKKIYRALEILPGFLTWGTLIAVILASWLVPVWATFFIIIFDLYWLIKTAYLSFHLRANWKKMRRYVRIDWKERLSNLKYEHIWHMIILPFYKEDFEIIDTTIDSLILSEWNKKKMIIVLAYEERAGEPAENIAKKIQEKHGSTFGHFIITKHPKDTPGELAGKSANVSYAIEEARKLILDAHNIKYEDVLVSNFDVDTRVTYPQYFLCVTWHFLTCEKPFRSSFQPVPVFNNNIWDAPCLSRVVAISSTFWQMIQQERPERLSTFSSHAVSFKTLHEIDYWQRNIVSEDSRIFWNALMYFDGDYYVVPVSYPVSMDANLAPTFWETTKNVYKQQLRWTWGVENVPYVLFGFLKNKKMALKTKLRYAFMQVEGFWSLATNPLIIFFLGWLPLTLGGERFNQTLLSYNLPRMTRDIMTLAMTGLILSAIISTTLLPPRPPHKKKYRHIFMILQWILIPFTIPVFGAIPGVHSQTRLMLGKYMGYWTTPKHREGELPSDAKHETKK